MKEGEDFAARKNKGPQALPGWAFLRYKHTGGLKIAKVTPHR